MASLILSKLNNITLLKYNFKLSVAGACFKHYEFISCFGIDIIKSLLQSINSGPLKGSLYPWWQWLTLINYLPHIVLMNDVFAWAWLCFDNSSYVSAWAKGTVSRW